MCAYFTKNKKAKIQTEFWPLNCYLKMTAKLDYFKLYIELVLSGSDMAFRLDTHLKYKNASDLDKTNAKVGLVSLSCPKL
jgi:hypothetical protein